MLFNLTINQSAMIRLNMIDFTKYNRKTKRFNIFINSLVCFILISIYNNDLSICLYFSIIFILFINL